MNKRLKKHSSNNNGNVKSGTDSDMSFSINDRVKVASWFDYTKSIDEVKLRFKRECNGRIPPNENDIRRWHSQLMETGSIRNELETIEDVSVLSFRYII